MKKYLILVLLCVPLLLAATHNPGCYGCWPSHSGGESISGTITYDWAKNTNESQNGECHISQGDCIQDHGGDDCNSHWWCTMTVESGYMAVAYLSWYTEEMYDYYDTNGTTTCLDSVVFGMGEDAMTCGPAGVIEKWITKYATAEEGDDECDSPDENGWSYPDTMKIECYTCFEI